MGLRDLFCFAERFVFWVRKGGCAWRGVVWDGNGCTCGEQKG